MDSKIKAFVRAQAAKAAGNKEMVFNWDKAAKLIVEKKGKNAQAGLRSDSGSGGFILIDSKIFVEEDDGMFLASLWAVPEIEIDNEVLECWIYMEDSPGWDHDTRWPDSARKILKDGGYVEV